MVSPQQVLAGFARAWEAGERPDVESWATRAGPARADEVRGLIADYLTTAPDPPATADRADDPRLARALAAAADERALWPAVLPGLRDRAELPRDEVALRLAAALDVPDAGDKVHAYLHEMETGRLDPAGVSRRVLDALAGVLGTARARLEAVGGGLAAVAPPPPASSAAFLREGRPASAPPDAPGAATIGDADPSAEPWDAVDRLFRGGR